MGAILGILRRGADSDCPSSELATWCRTVVGYRHAAWETDQLALAHAVSAAADDPAIITSNDDELILVADVRLDDRKRLIDALGSDRNHGSSSDGDLVLQAYRKWGVACPQHLLGDYAFAIWDARERTLFCARDPMGVRQFYYCLTDERLVFSSELSLILAAPRVPQELCTAYIGAHLSNWHFEHSERTFFASIRKLPAAHLMTINGGRVSQRQYWFPEESPPVRFADDADYAEAFLDVLRSAVHDRLRSSHGVGAHITGGLDSSGIAVLAARELSQQGKPLFGYCWEPPIAEDETCEDERALIQAVSDQERIALRCQTLTPEDLVTILRRDITRAPTVDTLIHEQHVQRQARADDVRVLLSGWGGDEFIGFNGRGYWADLFLRGEWRKLYGSCKACSGHPWRYLLRRGVLPAAPAWIQESLEFLRTGGVRSVRPMDFARRECVDELTAAGRSLETAPWREVGVRETQLQLLSLGHLTRRIEAWGSSGAQHGISYRYPLLDRRVVEFALGLPPEQFVRGATTRHLLRQTLAGIVPDSVRHNRDKTDPARTQMLNSVTAEAYAQIGKELQARSGESSRARYLDTGRLSDRLTHGESLSASESSAIWHALQFLDF